MLDAYTVPQPDMLPEFYSLGMLMEAHYIRRASSMKEAELRAAIAVQLALSQEDNQ